MHDDLGEVVKPAIFSHDGAWVAASTSDGKALFWSTSDQGSVVELNHGREAVAIAFDPTSKRVATTSAYDHSVVLWNLGSAEQLNALHCGHCFEPRRLQFSPDGRSLLVKYREEIVLWDLETMSVVRRRPLPSGYWFLDIWFGDRGPRKIEQTEDYNIRVGDVSGEQETIVLSSGFSEVVDSMALAPDGSRLAASVASEVRLWDLVNGKAISLAGDP